MKRYVNMVIYIYSKAIKILFFAYKTIQLHLSSKKKVKVLFSNRADWRPAIQRGFYFTRHKITFEDFSSGNIKDYDLVIPLTMSDLMYLTEVRDLVNNNPIPIPSKSTIQLCNDKYLFTQELIHLGFGEFIPKTGGTLPYPYMLKKKIDEWGQNIHVICNAQPEEKFKDLLNNPEYYTQEIITGKYEYATNILFKDQKIVCSLNIKYAFEKEIPIKGRDKPIYTEICLCPYLDTFSSILKAIGFEGLCCINYKVFDSRLWIFEINPRCGGSLCPYLFSFVEHVI